MVTSTMSQPSIHGCSNAINAFDEDSIIAKELLQQLMYP
jgi:hypothetical protein